MDPGDGPLRALLVGEDPLARAGLSAALGDRDDIVVTGAIAERSDVAVSAATQRAGLIVWDLGADGQLGARRVAELAAPVVALAVEPDQAARAMASGARGVVYRDGDAERLAAASRAVAHGLIVVDEPFRETLVQARTPEPGVESLTPREEEILQLLALGMSNPAIGRDLGISEHTVKFHVNSILEKMGAGTRTEAVVRAARMGLLLL